MGFTKVSLLIQNQCMTICLLVPALLRRGCWPSEHCRGPFSIPALLLLGCWTWMSLRPLILSVQLLCTIPDNVAPSQVWSLQLRSKSRTQPHLFETPNHDQGKLPPPPVIQTTRIYNVYNLYPICSNRQLSVKS